MDFTYNQKSITKKKLIPAILSVCRSPSSFIVVLLLFIFYLVVSFSSKASFPLDHAATSFNDGTFCNSHGAEQFILYAPHSGFSNQLSEFKNGLLIAGILNRTLVIPPVLDHHAVALGSCPKFRVNEPSEIRRSFWNHSLDLLKAGRYVSMADIIDVSSLVPSSVRVIDFRVFASMLCDVKADVACSKATTAHSSIFERLKECGSAATGNTGYAAKCVYPVDNDCKTTVWTYDSGENDGEKDSFQLIKKKKLSYIRLRRDIRMALGPGSPAESYKILAFGSLFSSMYKGSQLHIDIGEAKRDTKINSLLKKLEFLPFSHEILDAGKAVAKDMIEAPFLCAQLRLLDGQFKNHWEATFSGLKQKLESLTAEVHPMHIFVMTDLEREKWAGTYLGDLARDYNQWKIHSLREDDDIVIKTAEKVASLGKLNDVGLGDNVCSSRKLPDVLLYIEESVCSCASLGFVGTAGSTIADSVELMRKHKLCQIN